MDTAAIERRDPGTGGGCAAGLRAGAVRPFAPVLLTAAAVATGVAGCGNAPADAAGPPRPDVLVACVDDLGWGDLARAVRATGRAPRAATPAFDRLLSEGFAYRDAYASSPWAGETLTALLSGFAAPRAKDAAWVPTLAEQLRHDGYTAALVLGSTRHLDALVAPDERAEPATVPGFQDVLVAPGAERPEGARADDVRRLAAEWAGSTPGPQLVVCTFADPAAPHDAYLDVGVDLLDDGSAARRVPAGLPHGELLRRAPSFGAEERARLAALHASEVAAVDRAFGRLAQSVIERRTVEPVLALASLRAPALGANGRYGLVPSLEPDALRVPVVVRFPGAFHGRARPAGESDGIVSLVDLGPTLVDALGLEPRLDLDGRSVFPGSNADPGRRILASTARAVDAHAVLGATRASVEVSGPAAPSARRFERSAPAARWTEVTAEPTAPGGER